MNKLTERQVRRRLLSRHFLFIPFVLVVLTFSSFATAATVIVTPSKDATIFLSGGVNGLGDLFVGTSGLIGFIDERRALLFFNLTSIPVGAVITDASLTLSVLASQGTETGSLHKLLQNWAEGDQFGLSPGIGAGGSGGAPSPAMGGNDVTWTMTGLGPMAMRSSRYRVMSRVPKGTTMDSARSISD